jgi:hypothetical protein
MTPTVLLAMAFAVFGMASAFAPVEKFVKSSPNRIVAATEVTFLFPKRGSRLVAFSHEYRQGQAKGSIVGTSNPPSPRRWVQNLGISSNSPRVAVGVVASAAKSLVTRLMLGHVECNTARCRMKTLEKELMNAYSKDPISYPEDEVLFRQIVD